MKKKKIKMMNLFKDRANIFDKISFGISLIPILTMITMFTQFFREGLVVNGIHFANEALYSAIWDITLDFFSRISGFQMFIIGALFVYQMWFIVNYCVTKLDGRRKKRTHDFGLFLLCCSVWVSIIMFTLIFILAVWDFKWLTVWFFGLLKSFQPMTSVIIIALILALIYIIVSVKYIVTKGFDKYLKECEKSDYEFSKTDLFIGITKILVILLFAVIVSFEFINIIM